MLLRAALPLAVAAYLVASPALTATEPQQHSDEISILFAQAKSEAHALRHDVDMMEGFERSHVSAPTHGTALTQIAAHINQAGRLLEKMHAARESGSPLQQQAIDQVTPLLKELAANVQSVVDKINEHSSYTGKPEFAEYVAENCRLATELAALIQNLVDYEQSKEKVQALESQLKRP